MVEIYNFVNFSHISSNKGIFTVNSSYLESLYFHNSNTIFRASKKFIYSKDKPLSINSIITNYLA